MREESHLDDMRSAIRGDFERLAERRGGQELMRELELEPEPDLEPESEVPEPVPEPISEAEPDPALVVEPPGAAESGPTPERELEAEPTSDGGSPDESAPRRTFLDRLLGR